MKRIIRTILCSLLFIMAATAPILAAETEGDERILIPSRETKRSVETPNQITLTARVPEHFGLSCYGILTDLSTGETYELPLYAENDYTERIYLSDGTYGVTEIAVYGDNTDHYPFSYPQDFTARKGAAIELATTLLNYDQVEREIAGKLPETAPEIETEEVESEVYTVYHHVTEDNKRTEGNEKIWIAAAALFFLFLLGILILIEGMKSKIPGKSAYHISTFVPLKEKTRKQG